MILEHELMFRYNRGFAEGLNEGKSTGFAGESSAGCIISNKLTNNSLCKISSVRIGYTQKPEEIEKLLNQALYDSNLTINNIDLVMTGINGNPENDEVYTKNLEYLNIRCAKLGFTQLFGESYSGSVYGVYGSALCLKKLMLKLLKTIRLQQSVTIGC